MKIPSLPVAATEVQQNENIEMKPKNDKDVEMQRLMSDDSWGQWETDLKLILSNKECFEVYLKYLSNELRTHYLLGFVEIVQFQRHVMDQDGLDLDGLDTEYEAKQPLFKTVNFYEDVPRSHIVHSNDEEEDEKDPERTIKNKGNALFEKYIALGAYNNPLTLRLPSTDSIEDTMYEHASQETNNMRVIMMAFDRACRDIWDVLVAGMARFEETTQYQQLGVTQYTL